MAAPSARAIREAWPELTRAKSEELARALKHPRLDADDALNIANDILMGFGVEAIRAEGAWVSNYYGDIIGLHVNMGDTYDATIVYDTVNEDFLLTSWGDFYQWWEEEGRQQTSMEELDEDDRHSWRPR